MVTSKDLTKTLQQEILTLNAELNKTRHELLVANKRIIELNKELGRYPKELKATNR